VEINKKWMLAQLENRKFKILLALQILIEAALIIEFILLSYSALKIIRYAVLLAALFLIAWIDWHEKRIPNSILKALLFIRILLLVPEWVLFAEIGWSLLLSSVFGMLTGGILFLLVYFLSRGGVGMGDVKLMGIVGCYAGIGGIMPVIFLTVTASAIYSVILLALKKIRLKEEIPFAPFVLAGTVLAMALGI
jgi:prepilin signal peptidase PulO-like enzyme (type II secretory pathway)